MAAPFELDVPLGPLNDNFKWFLANFSFSSTPQEIKQYFSSFGAVNYVKIIFDNKQQRSKGYGFLFMMDERGDREVERFAQSQQHRINMLGKARVLLQRHDQSRAQPMPNPSRRSHDENVLGGAERAPPPASHGSHYGPASAQHPPDAYGAPPPAGPSYDNTYQPQPQGYATSNQHAPPGSYDAAPYQQQPPPQQQQQQQQYSSYDSYAAPANQGYGGAGQYQYDSSLSYGYANPPPTNAAGSYAGGAYEYGSASAYGAAPSASGYAAVPASASTYGPASSYGPGASGTYGPPASSSHYGPDANAPNYGGYQPPQQTAPQQAPVTNDPYYSSAQPPNVTSYYGSTAPQPQQQAAHPNSGGGGGPPPPPPTQPLSTKLLLQNLPVNVIPKDVVTFLQKQHSISVRRCTMEYDQDPNATWCYAHIDVSSLGEASRLLEKTNQQLVRYQGTVLQASRDAYPPPDGVNIPVGMGAPISTGPRPPPRDGSKGNGHDGRGRQEGPPRRNVGGGRGGNHGRGRGGRSSSSRDSRRDRPY